MAELADHFDAIQRLGEARAGATLKRFRERADEAGGTRDGQTPTACGLRPAAPSATTPPALGFVPHDHRIVPLPGRYDDPLVQTSTGVLSG